MASGQAANCEATHGSPGVPRPPEDAVSVSGSDQPADPWTQASNDGWTCCPGLSAAALVTKDRRTEEGAQDAHPQGLAGRGLRRPASCPNRSPLLCFGAIAASQTHRIELPLNLLVTGETLPRETALSAGAPGGLLDNLQGRASSQEVASVTPLWARFLPDEVSPRRPRSDTCSHVGLGTDRAKGPFSPKTITVPCVHHVAIGGSRCPGNSQDSTVALTLSLGMR